MDLCRRFNCAEHGREGFVAVEKRLYAVARRQRLTDDATDHVCQLFQMLYAGGLRFTQMFRNGTDDGSLHSERNRTAADAVDAEREIQNWAKDGQKPDSREPKRRGTWISFMEQGVKRSEQRGQNIKACHQVRPEPGNCIQPVHRGNSCKGSPLNARMLEGFFGDPSRRIHLWASCDTVALRGFVRSMKLGW